MMTSLRPLIHLPLLQKILKIEVEDVNAFRRQMNTVSPIQTSVCATTNIIMGKRGTAELWDDAVDSAIHSGSDQINFMVVSRMTPHPPRKDVGPHQDTLRENAPYGGQILFDWGQQVGGTICAKVIATQVNDQYVWAGPGVLQLVELGQQLGPCHPLNSFPPQGDFV